MKSHVEEAWVIRAGETPTGLFKGWRLSIRNCLKADPLSEPQIGCFGNRKLLKYCKISAGVQRGAFEHSIDHARVDSLASEFI